jgi:hypothetical protein
MAKSSFNQSPTGRFDEVPTTYLDAKNEGYEHGAMVEATVAEKHLGTLDDQHDMKVLGRIQELRV